MGLLIALGLRRSADETLDSSFQSGAFHEDVAAAALAADPHVGAQSLDFPLIATAWVRLPGLHHVTDIEF